MLRIGRLALIQSLIWLLDPTAPNEVAGQENGVNVVRFHGGIAQVVQRPTAGIRTASSIFSLASATELEPRGGDFVQ